jgi:hypothetical protein
VTVFMLIRTFPTHGEPSLSFATSLSPLKALTTGRASNAEEQPTGHGPRGCDETPIVFSNASFLQFDLWLGSGS